MDIVNTPSRLVPPSYPERGAAHLLHSPQHPLEEENDPCLLSFSEKTALLFGTQGPFTAASPSCLNSAEKSHMQTPNRHRRTPSGKTLAARRMPLTARSPKHGGGLPIVPLQSRTLNSQDSPLRVINADQQQSHQKSNWKKNLTPIKTDDGDSGRPVIVQRGTDVQRRHSFTSTRSLNPIGAVEDQANDSTSRTSHFRDTYARLNEADISPKKLNRIIMDNPATKSVFLAQQTPEYRQKTRMYGTPQFAGRLGVDRFPNAPNYYVRSWTTGAELCSLGSFTASNNYKKKLRNSTEGVNVETEAQVVADLNQGEEADNRVECDLQTSKHTFEAKFVLPETSERSLMVQVDKSFSDECLQEELLERHDDGEHHFDLVCIGSTLLDDDDNSRGSIVCIGSTMFEDEQASQQDDDDDDDMSERSDGMMADYTDITDLTDLFNDLSATDTSYAANNDSCDADGEDNGDEFSESGPSGSSTCSSTSSSLYDTLDVDDVEGGTKANLLKSPFGGVSVATTVFASNVTAPQSPIQLQMPPQIKEEKVKTRCQCVIS